MEIDLIFKIGKKKYIEMEILLVGDKVQITENKLLEMGCIRRYIKEIKQSGMFYNGFVRVSYLVPLDKITDFQKVE